MRNPEDVFTENFNPEIDETTWFHLSDKDHEFAVCQSDVLQALRFAEKEHMIPPLPPEWWDKELAGYVGETQPPESDDNWLEALKKTLRNNFRPAYYSLNGYKEGAVCLEKAEDGYVVYTAERDQKNELTACASASEACLAFIASIAGGEKRNRLLCEFEKNSAMKRKE